MANNEVVISARVDLDEISKQLDLLRRRANLSGREIASAGKEAHDKVSAAAKNSSNSLEALRLHSRRIADEVKGAFEAMLKVKALDLGKTIVGGMKESVKASSELNDTLRKISMTLGLTGDKLLDFQNRAQKAFANVGLGAEDAARAMEGVAKTGMTDPNAMLSLAVQSAQLGKATGGGDPGEIAANIARVTRARGKDPNDPEALSETVKTLQKVAVSGKTDAGKASGELADFYESTSTDKRNRMGTDTFGETKAVSAAIGTEVFDLVKEIMSKNNLESMPAEMQGLAAAMKDGGFDLLEAAKVFRKVGERIGFSPEAAQKTLGIDNAAGAMTLAKSLEKLPGILAQYRSQNVSLRDQQLNNQTLGEAGDEFGNKVKATFAEPINFMTNAATNVVKAVNETENGPQMALAGGALAAGGILAMLKNNPATKGIAGSIGGTAVSATAAEAVFGHKTIPVFVVNAADIANGGIGGMAGGLAAGGAMPGVLGKASGLAQKAGVAGLGAMLGLEIGKAIEPMVTNVLDKAFTSTWTTKDGAEMKGNPIERLISIVSDGIERIAGAFEGLATAFPSAASALNGIFGFTKKTADNTQKKPNANQEGRGGKQ